MAAAPVCDTRKTARDAYPRGRYPAAPVETEKSAFQTIASPRPPLSYSLAMTSDAGAFALMAEYSVFSLVSNALRGNQGWKARLAQARPAAPPTT